MLHCNVTDDSYGSHVTAGKSLRISAAGILSLSTGHCQERRSSPPGLFQASGHSMSSPQRLRGFEVGAVFWASELLPSKVLAVLASDT